jgi:hypothetical protein
MPMRTNKSHELAEEQLIRSYFLGDLPESEQDRIQERVFTDRDFFESLLIVEDELVDDYALGLISNRERTKLEKGLLMSPYQHQRVRFVKTLERYIAENKTTFGSSLRRLAKPSLFTRLRLRFVKSASSPLGNRSSQTVKKQEDIWERSLGEAQANRDLIRSLMNDNWLGLELLLQLKTVPEMRRTELTSLTKRDDAALTRSLSGLIDCGLVHQNQGKYSCSWFGSEILEKVKAIL